MLYLISSKNYLKIGYSDDIQSRILCYKTHNPNCKLLATRQGSRISENYFHILLSKYKINKTEWMTYDNFIIESFSNLSLKKLDSTIISDEVSYHEKIEIPNKVLSLSKSESSVYLYLKSYNNNEVVVNKYIVQDIMNKTKLAKSTIKNALTSLVRKNIIKRKEHFTATYIILD